MTASRRKRIKKAVGELEIIRADGPAYQALIGRAVADAEVYESVHGAIKSLFDEGGERACTRAIEVATHLGDRAPLLVILRSICSIHHPSNCSGKLG